MGRILRPDELSRTLGELDRQIQKLKRAPVLNSWPRISTPNNSANQNQTVPAVGNFDGLGTKFDVTMLTTCVFTLTAPSQVIWLSYTTLKATAPGGGTFVYLTTEVSLSPWNPAQVIFASGSQLFDKGIGGYINSSQQFAIAPGALQGTAGPGATALGITTGPLPAGTYEVRQRMFGDLGTQVLFYQGNIDVYQPGG